jgi:HPt (histidine-containing phosphotransfer) domain-containing protein
VLGEFVETTPNDVTSLETAVNEKNNEKVTAWAHKLKSSFRHLGMEQAADACKELEFIGKGKQSDENMQNLMDVVSEQFAGALEEVKNLMKAISDTFKSAIQSTIVPALKNNSSTAEHLTQVDALIRQIYEFQQKVNQLSDAAKASIDANLQKILGLLSNLETIKQRIQSIVAAGSNSSNTSPNAEQSNNNRTDAILEEILQKAREVLPDVIENAILPADARSLREKLQKFASKIQELLSSVTAILVDRAREVLNNILEKIRQLGESEVNNTRTDDMVSQEPQVNPLELVRDNHL